MSDQYNSPMDQNEFMKRMKAIASDLWGGVMPVATTEAPAAAEPAQPKPAVKETEKPGTEIKTSGRPLMSPLTGRTRCPTAHPRTD